MFPAERDMLILDQLPVPSGFWVAGVSNTLAAHGARIADHFRLSQR